MTTCEFGPCTCEVEDGLDHCGPSCRMGIGGGGESCKCGHADCTATVGKG